MDEPGNDGPVRPTQKLEPTYQMEPHRKFPTGQVQHILKEVLDRYLAEERYEPELARQMSKTLTDVSQLYLGTDVRRWLRQLDPVNIPQGDRTCHVMVR